MAKYEAGTRVSDITGEFNRGIKIEFECESHPGSAWMSKDPYSSQWFPQARNISPMGMVLVNCNCNVNSMITTSDYETL